MTDQVPPFVQRVNRLKSALEEVEEQVLDEDPPADLLEDLKATVDHLRTAVWAAVTSDSSGGHRAVLAQVRCVRILEMLEAVTGDIEAGLLDRNTSSYRSLREGVFEAARTFERDAMA